MRYLYLAIVASIANAAAWAAPPEVGDWRQANERVREAGGWKAYAREIEPASSPQVQHGLSSIQGVLSLDAAMQRALALDPGLQQTLATVTRSPALYLTLTDHQRAALTREAQLRANVSSLFYAAIAAQERLGYQLQVTEVASIIAELATRMRQAGNLNALHRAEEQLSLAQSEKALSEARLAASATREALARRLQLSGSAATDLVLPSRLPNLPAPDALAPAALSPIDTHLLAADAPNPAAVRAQSEVRQAALTHREAYLLAQRHRDEILPLARRISEEHVLQYNGMIIGIFDLLKDARQQIQAVEGYLDALHAFWQADSELTPKLFALREQLSTFRRDAWK